MNSLPMRGEWSSYQLLLVEFAEEARLDVGITHGSSSSLSGTAELVKETPLEAYQRGSDPPPSNRLGQRAWAQDEIAASSRLATQMTEWLSQVTVLIVEDEPRIASLFERSVKPWGARVHVASTLELADQMWRATGGDVLIVDGWLGEQSSGDWLATILKSNPETMVILSTADTRMSPAGVRWMLEKPFDQEMLDSMVRQVVSEVLARKLFASNVAPK